jgi:uracil-DNA glycosylase family 4
MIDPMLAKPSSCQGCPLAGKTHGFVTPSGAGSNGILVVGDVPSFEDEHSGYAYSGPIGGKLNHLMSLAGFQRNEFRLTHTLSCRPPQGKLLGLENEWAIVNHCWPNLEQTIQAMQPAVILALGESALKRLTNRVDILRWRGRPIRMTNAPHTWVMPTLPPEFLLPRRGDAIEGIEGFRNPSRMTGVVIMDIKRAWSIRMNGFTPRDYTQGHLLDPSPEEFERWARRYEYTLLTHAPGAVLLVFDIETAYKMSKLDEEDLDEGELKADDRIIRISFAYNDPSNPEQQFQGVSVPWDAAHMPTIVMLLGLGGRKGVWNGDTFDVPLIRKHGVPVSGRIEDFMWGWHMLQSDLPYGLEFVTSIYLPDMAPWKHLNNENPALYSALDSVATLGNAIGIERELRRAA